MKRTLLKFKRLAQLYVEWGIKMQLRNTHNKIKGLEGVHINIYFDNDGKTWSVDFGFLETSDGHIGVCGYADKIEVPYEFIEDQKKYEALLPKLYSFLDVELQERLSKKSDALINEKKERLKRIKEEEKALKNDINQLKSI